MILKRDVFKSTGIFGQLLRDDWSHMYYTIEHPYPVGDNFISKIPIGAYKCVRGEHTLEHHPVPFETFEITGVPGHTNILIHIANISSDVDGCVGIGLESDMNFRVSSSFAAFTEFMQVMSGIDSFVLNVF